MQVGECEYVKLSNKFKLGQPFRRMCLLIILEWNGTDKISTHCPTAHKLRQPMQLNSTKPWSQLNRDQLVNTHQQLGLDHIYSFQQFNHLQNHALFHVFFFLITSVSTTSTHVVLDLPRNQTSRYYYFIIKCIASWTCKDQNWPRP